jgi:hypothetical protein
VTAGCAVKAERARQGREAAGGFTDIFIALSGSGEY